MRAPSLSPAKGGGALSGMGEKFQASAVTGTASFSVPLAATSARTPAPPFLGLSYDSGLGNGPLGLGWQVALPAVRRKTDKKLPTYRDGRTSAADDVDTFVMSDFEDLVPWTGADPTRQVTEEGTSYDVFRYRPRTEGGFARIERFRDQGTGVSHWRSRTRDNTVRIYGLSESARLADPSAPSRVYEWLFEEERDEFGHIVRIEYKQENTSSWSAPTQIWETGRKRPGHAAQYVFPKRVFWANKAPDVPAVGASTAGSDFCFELVFDYGEHDATAPTPSEVQPWVLRADPFSSFRAGFDVRCYRLCQRTLLFHRFSALPGPTLVRSTEFAYAGPGSPPYSAEVAAVLVSVQTRGWRWEAGTPTTEALPALSFTYTEPVLGQSVELATGLDDLPHGLDTARWQFVDLDGEGLDGLISEQGNAWYWKRNEGGGRFAPARALGSRPAVDLAGASLQDVQGDGRLDVVRQSPGQTGYWARSAEGSWEPFRSFRQVPTELSLDDGQSRVIDLDGDGLGDMLITEENALSWYPFLGEEGWGPKRRQPRPIDEAEGPRVAFASTHEAILLADMNGDGLADIVRVRPSSVCYWPNLGYGRFGAKVTMGSAPLLDNQEGFDGARVRLADVDGAGPADLIYLGRDAIRLYTNRSGNSFGPEQRLRLPSPPPGANVQVADLLGTGTACLVWSSPLLRDATQALRYVRLMPEGKPYLMRSFSNGLGRTTTLTYKPSSDFYVADRQAGTPWATRLPFPVQCLWRVEVHDQVSGWRNTQTYSYHHGFFDPVEREFRGFGRVDRQDTESVQDYGDGPHAMDPMVLPATLTKSWYHTGAWREGAGLEPAFALEQWWEDEARTLPRAPAESEVIGVDSPAESRDAARALRGQLLREEVFGLDGNPRLYVVTRHAHRVERIQARDGARPAVLQVLPLGSLSAHYERLDPPDPRVTHSLPLQWDEHGTVLLEAAIQYPRRTVPSSELSAQGVGAILLAERVVLDDDDPERLHLAVPVLERQWQLLPGWALDDTTPLVREDVLAFVHGSPAEIDFADWDAAGPGKRLLSDIRFRYWNDDGTSELPEEEIGTRVALRQKYQRVFTADLRVEAFDSGFVSDADLVAAGYAALPGGGSEPHWLPSGYAHPDTAHFWLPDQAVDPWGSDVDIAWDADFQFVLSLTDVLDNVTTATIDYQALQPSDVEDPNGVLARATFDALGRPTKTWVEGASGEGDDEDHPTVAITYEVHRWLTSTLPARVHTVTRQTHFSEDPNDDSLKLHRYVYSDGGGKAISEKVQAEPDPATPSTPRWVGTGRVVLNNKGLAVKQYEPYFSASEEHDFDDEVAATGVTPVLLYDPLGRNIRTDLPHGAFVTVAFDPWRQTVRDEHDNVLDSDWYDQRIGLPAGHPEREAAEAAAEHADTETTLHLDALGRAFRGEAKLASSTALATVATLDLQGNPRQVTDPRGVVVQTQVFDMLGRAIRTESPDAGTTQALVDVAGQPTRIARSGDLLIEASYDTLRRRVRQEVTEGAGPTRVVERALFGEEIGAPAYGRGRPWRVYDTAGFVETEYTFAGQPATTTRRFLADDIAEPDWSDLDAWTDPPDIQAEAESSLEEESFETSATWDALLRPVTEAAPDGSVTTWIYNSGGQLASIQVQAPGATTPTPVLSSVAYNARGQRTSVVLGDAAASTHMLRSWTHDPQTFRVARIETTRTGWAAQQRILQDLLYTWDAVGNVTQIQDDAQSVIYFANQAVAPIQTFEHDALYRLTGFWGRERSGDPGQGWALPSPDTSFVNPSSPTTCEEHYTYDASGNLTARVHSTPIGNLSWTRDYDYATDSNRLLSSDVDATSETFTYTARGAMDAMPHLPGLVRDFRDQIRRVDLQVGQDPDTVRYLYDGAGRRVRTVARLGANTEVRSYVGRFEVWRKTVGSTLTEERTTLHVEDGTARVAMLERKTIDAGTPVGSPTPMWRFQFDNHLGTACVETTEAGALISYEEYHPYGTTSWWAQDSTIDVSSKRYRFTGMERDEHTGLQLHGARWYAPWLGRWTSADPIGIGDGANVYAYCGGHPTRAVDPQGLAETDERRTIQEDVRTTPSHRDLAHEWGRATQGALARGVHLDWNRGGQPSVPSISAVTPEMEDKRHWDNAITGQGGEGLWVAKNYGPRTAALYLGWSNVVGLVNLVREAWEPTPIRVLQESGQITDVSPVWNEARFSLFMNVAPLLVGATIPRGIAPHGLASPRVAEAGLTADTVADASSIRFSQKTIGRTFTSGGTLRDAIEGLRSGAISPEAFPPIRLLERNGLTFTLDNRRLFVFQQAGMPIRTVPATAEEIAAEAWKFTTRNEGASVRVRGGL